jgi:hypothetical protein
VFIVVLFLSTPVEACDQVPVPSNTILVVPDAIDVPVRVKFPLTVIVNPLKVIFPVVADNDKFPATVKLLPNVIVVIPLVV